MDQQEQEMKVILIGRPILDPYKATRFGQAIMDFCEQHQEEFIKFKKELHKKNKK